METNEIRTENEVKVIDIGTDYEIEEAEVNGGLIAKVVLGVGSLLLGGVYAFKNRDKLLAKKEEKEVEKLKKKGYVVYKKKAEAKDAEIIDVEAEEE